MKKEKKLHLGKVTVCNLGNVLDREEQKPIKGGTGDVPLGTTQVPIYCKP